MEYKIIILLETNRAPSMYYILWLEGEILERKWCMLFIFVSPMWLAEWERERERKHNCMTRSRSSITFFVFLWLELSQIVHLYDREMGGCSVLVYPQGKKKCGNMQHCLSHNSVPGLVRRKIDPLGKQIFFSVFYFPSKYGCNDQKHSNLTSVKTETSLLWIDLLDLCLTFFLNCLGYSSMPSSSFHFLTFGVYRTDQDTMYFLP